MTKLIPAFCNFANASKKLKLFSVQWSPVL
jgi:hypothetical protein